MPLVTVSVDGSRLAIFVSTTAPILGWVNVKSFGAVGDGAADDAAALNAACAAARALKPTGNGVAIVYLPAGIYKCSATVNTRNVYVKGDGRGATKVLAASDWASVPNGSWLFDQQPSSAGVGQPAPDATHLGPSPTVGTWVEDLWLAGPKTRVRGAVAANLSGIRVGNGCGHGRLRIDGFFAGSFIFSDHEKILGPGEQGGNYYGIYFGEPSGSNGDQTIGELQLDGAGWASIGISANQGLGNVMLRRLHLGEGPFGIYKEASSAQFILAGCSLEHCSFESAGNGNIFAATGGGDIQNTVFAANPSTNALDSGTSIPLSTPDWQGRPIGRCVAPIDLGSGNWWQNEVLGADPAYPHPNPTSFPYSAMIACGTFLGGNYRPAADSLARCVTDGTVFVRGGSPGDAIVMSRGTRARLLRVSAAVAALALVESAGGGTPGCQPSSGARVPVGVALHGASSGVVPVAYEGLVNVRCGTNSVAANDPLIPDPAQAGCVKTGALTSGGIVGVAQQPGANGMVQALLRGL